MTMMTMMTTGEVSEGNIRKHKEKVVLVVTGVPIPNLTVVFVVRF